MQAYIVASGVIIEQGRLLLVQNERRNGSRDWSTPGGVVDPGEEMLQALSREVTEETALLVHEWSAPLYTIDVDFVGRDMTLHAAVFGSLRHAGELYVDDPDQVVVDARWVDLSQALTLLDTSPRWVSEPLRHYLPPVVADPPAIDSPPRPTGRFTYRVQGTADGFSAELVTFDDGT